MSLQPRRNSAKQKFAVLLVFAFIANLFVPIASAAKRLEVLGAGKSSERTTAPEPLMSQAAGTQADLVRLVQLQANDVIYSPVTKMLYASVPSSSGSNGNSITAIDPLTTSVGNSVLIGSEPSTLALSDDGKSLYTLLSGAFSIRRFDVMAQTPGIQFPVGQDSFSGRYTASDLAVAPGNPNLLAVARSSQFGGQAGIAAFDNGVQRTKTSTQSDFLAFSASASTLYTGSFNGLRTMAIDASGVTDTNSNTAFSVQGRIKFDNGLVFSSSGQVIDPVAKTLLGTFPGVSTNAFVTDSSVGRAYYLSSQFGGSSITVTVTAFDLNTFVPVGTLSIPGVNGTPTTVIRWGANGLAFRTTSNQLYVIQTSLIPSAEPVPTPSPTPSPSPSPTPTPFDTFVQQVSLNTRSMIYDQGTQKLYASVPSNAGSIGNSITAIDPLAGTIGNSVFVGSEPDKLAAADDGHTVYVSLIGAAAIRRFDTASQTAGIQFSVGPGAAGPPVINDIAVSPGNPDRVAVARSNTGISTGVAIFDGGQQLAKVGSDSSFVLAYSNSPATLYGYNGALNTISIDNTGVTSTTSTSFTGSRIVYDNGLVYGSNGQVINPATGAIIGAFSGVNNSGFQPQIAVDSAHGRVYFLVSSNSGGAQLRAYDINTFLPIGSVNIGGVVGSPTSLVFWGTNGIAFRTDFSSSGSGTGSVFLVRTALINPAEPVPAPTPTPSPTPSPSPVYIPTFTQRANLPANDVVYSTLTKTLYASVPGAAGLGGNSITPVDPQTAIVGAPVFIGSEPNKLALSDDGSSLYASLDGAGAIRRFDIASQTAGTQFPWGTNGSRPFDMDVVPGSPQSLVINDDGTGKGATIYDNGVKRPNSGKGQFSSSIAAIEFGANPSVLYAYDNSSGLVKFAVDSSGLTTLQTTSNLLCCTANGFKFSNGLLFLGSGRLLDPESKTILGTFQGIDSSAAMTVDSTLGRVFVFSGQKLTAYDINTFVPLGSVSFPSITGQPTKLVRWGVNGLAVRTAPSGFPSQSGLFIIQSGLVSNAAPVPTGISLSAQTYSVSEGSGKLTITLNRTGDISSANSVNYTTSDGTATAGKDYTATNGVLTFAAGEQTKTIDVPIIENTLFEGTTKTFNFSLSNPTGGTLLTAPSTAVVSISDNDSKPNLSISGVRVPEGTTGTTNALFVLTLSNSTVQDVTVDYKTVDGTAKAGSDYTATSGTLTIPAGTTTANISVAVNGDTVVEPDETFSVQLSNPTNISFFLVQQVVGTIANDDAPPDLAIFLNATPNPVLVGNNITYTITAANNTPSTADNVLVTDNLPANTSFVSCTASGAGVCGGTGNNRTVTFPQLGPSASASITLTVKVDPSLASGTVLTNTATVSYALTDPKLENNSATASVTAVTPPGFEFSAPNFDTSEGAGAASITISRLGDSSDAVSIDYSTSDGTAKQNSDYTVAAGTVQFAPGETTKSFSVLLTDDSYIEGDEVLTLSLSNPKGPNAGFGTQVTATITIKDNDATVSDTNPADDALFFVRQHYLDFLSREPDPAGQAYWTDQIVNCTPQPQCMDGRRAAVSAAFFIETEFQDTGGFVYRFYKASYGQRPAYNQFMPDRSRVIGGKDLEAGKQSFADAWVQRAEFLQKYPVSMSGPEFIDAVLLTVQQGSGVDLTSKRQALIDDYNANLSRSRIIRLVADDPMFKDAEYNKAFVLMQYFGYLRRDPEEGGYLFWLDVLNNKVPGNYRGMVCAFINSKEYQDRFSPTQTHNDRICSNIAP